MDGSEQLAQLDQHFVDVYEAARAKVVERQKQEALIVIQDDDLLLYRTGHALERFPGLTPPLYNKMKTLGHIPLGVFCLLHGHTGESLPANVLEQAKTYRAAIEKAAAALDTQDEAKTGILPAPSRICPKVTEFLDAVIAECRVSTEALHGFAKAVAPDIGPVLAAAAHAQLDACNAIMTHIRDDLLDEDQWACLHVLVLGPYMARSSCNISPSSCTRRSKGTSAWSISTVTTWLRRSTGWAPPCSMPRPPKPCSASGSVCIATCSRTPPRAT